MWFWSSSSYFSLTSVLEINNNWDLGSVPGLGRSPGETGYPRQYSCLAGHSPRGLKGLDTTEQLTLVLIRLFNLFPPHVCNTLGTPFPTLCHSCEHSATCDVPQMSHVQTLHPGLPAHGTRICCFSPPAPGIVWESVPLICEQSRALC